jgi:fructose-bisphosphate aldolase class I
MDTYELEMMARQLVAEGQGILAADESTRTITRRLKTIDVESTPETRRAYRQLLFTTPEIENYISGVILYDETIRQSADDGTPFRELLSSRGIVPGIKVDKGTADLPFLGGEKITEGLDGLRQRLAEYAEMGAGFTKWRAVITIGDHAPTDTCISANALALARFAALSQEAGLVPIVEPEVLMDGDHSIQRCEEVTLTTLGRVFAELMSHWVHLEGMLLKPNMVISGEDSPEQAGVEEVAEATIRCLRRTVPAAVPGIVFLSGGQTPERATAHLNAMNARGPHPWELSFSYGRALQEPPLNAWHGREENVPEAQRLFLWRARLNSEARYGRYMPEMGKEAETISQR